MGSSVESSVLLDGQLTFEEVGAVAAGAQLELDQVAMARVATNRGALEQLLASHTPIYGSTTGFGALASEPIPDDLHRQLQVNLLRSHAAGVGEALPKEIVRAAMAIRLNGLLLSHSGVRPELLERIVLLLNHGFIPQVPRTGSLGASGDLAPSAHAFLPLIGEGEVFTPSSEIITGAETLKHLGVDPFVLEAKEGLALINGTHFMTGIGCLTALRVRDIMDNADIAAALSLDALRAGITPFDQRVQELKPVPGQIRTALNIREILADSNRLRDHEHMSHMSHQTHWPRISSGSEGPIQDAYSLRCVPQVHGAAREGADFFERLVAIDLNAVTDNPLVFEDPTEVISAGNFHGQSLALAFDVLRLALADLSSISERRLFRLLSPSLNGGLPPFLSPNPGPSSGYMICQYTVAALISELRALAHPVSNDSISTSDNQEDHVSMGMTGALMTLDVLPKVEQVIAYEVLCACQAFDLDPSAEPSPAVKTIHANVRKHLPPLVEDRPPARDLKIMCELIEGGLLTSVLREKA